MAFFQRIPVVVTTDASGDATVYSEAVNGYLMQIDVPADFDNTGDITITKENGAETLYAGTNVAAAVTVYPHVPAQDSAGADVTYDGTNEIYTRMAFANERIKIVVAQGGNALSGTFYFVVGG